MGDVLRQLQQLALQGDDTYVLVSTSLKFSTDLRATVCSASWTPFFFVLFVSLCQLFKNMEKDNRKQKCWLSLAHFRRGGGGWGGGAGCSVADLPTYEPGHLASSLSLAYILPIYPSDQLHISPKRRLISRAWRRMTHRPIPVLLLPLLGYLFPREVTYTTSDGGNVVTMANTD